MRFSNQALRRIASRRKAQDDFLSGNIEHFISKLQDELEICRDYARMNPPDSEPLQDLNAAVREMQDILDSVSSKEY